MKKINEITRKLQDMEIFSMPKIKEEQYITPADIASDLIWKAFMLKDIEGKEIIDLGCGTGILGIASLLLGAKSCIFLDKDEDALNICRRNLQSLEINEENYILLNEDIKNTDIKADVVIMNPPFGTKIKHADKRFLEKAIESPVVYSFHKTNTLDFVKAFVKDHKKEITHIWHYSYPLKKSMEHHRKKIEYIDVSVVRIK